nr:hypothetical protein [Bacteroidota bacterium]
MKNLLKILSFTIFFAGIIFASSCKKDVKDDPNQKLTMDELLVPQDFDWKTTADVDVTINISGTKAYEAMSKVYVYSADPSIDGKLMASGTACSGKAFKTMMRVPAYFEEVYLKMESPFG